MKILVSSAVLASALAVGGVSAADLVIDEPVLITDSSFDWSGFYAGLNAGYVSGTATSVGAVSGVTTNVPVSGGLLGATIGFNAQVSDNFVLGVEGDVAWSGATGTAPCAANPAFACEGDLNWLGAVKARAGFAADNLLLFATAGLAAGGATANVIPAAPGITNTYSGIMTGWTIGGGIETAVTDAISVKAEYNYVSLGGLQAPVGTVSSTQASDLRATTHVVKVGVNFHF